MCNGAAWPQAHKSAGVSEMPNGPIVAGTDDSAMAEVAVDRGAELARALGAQVYVVTAYSSGSLGTSTAAAARMACRAKTTIMRGRLRRRSSTEPVRA